MPWTQRLLPDAYQLLSGAGDSHGAPSGMRRAQARGGSRRLQPGSATPRALAGPIALLARGTGGPTRAEWLPLEDESPGEMEVLWPSEGGWTAAHDRIAARLMDHGVLRLHLDGTPDEAVTALEEALAARSARSEPAIP
jgi:hypothetical protein